MIVISMLLVIVGAVTLVIGAFLRDDLTLVWVSIASCLLAGVFLVIGIIRSRPSRKPVLASGGEGQEASWSGAATWSGADRAEGEGAGATQVLEREAAEEPAVQVVAADDLEEVETPAEEQAQRWQPEEPEPAAEPDEEVVVVTGRRAGADRDAPATKKAAKKGAKKAAKKGARKAAKKSAKKGAKKAAARRGGGLDAVLSEVSGVGPGKRAKLAERFGDLDGLRAASVEDIQQIEGISATLARRIHDHLR